LARIQLKDYPGQWGELPHSSVCSKRAYFKPLAGFDYECQRLGVKALAYPETKVFS
jgi:hypothetical protein